MKLHTRYSYILLLVFQSCVAADLAIQIPGNLNQDGIYRLDYSPPHGVPSPNTTIASRDIGDVIEFSQVLPGTKYNFWLYYSNNTRHDWLTWTASITTGEFRARLAACALSLGSFGMGCHKNRFQARRFVYHSDNDLYHLPLY